MTCETRERGVRFCACVISMLYLYGWPRMCTVQAILVWVCHVFTLYHNIFVVFFSRCFHSFFISLLFCMDFFFIFVQKRNACWSAAHTFTYFCIILYIENAIRCGKLIYWSWKLKWEWFFFGLVYRSMRSLVQYSWVLIIFGDIKIELTQILLN